MIANAQHRILWLPGEERMWDEEYSSRSAAGIRIDASNALQVSAVFACLRILSETVASLPLHVLERMTRGTRRAVELPLYRRLHQQPNEWQTSFEWREQAVFHVGLWGDAYSEIRSGASGAVDQLIPLHPSRMKVERIENGRLRYKYREENGRETVYSQDAILHMRGPSDDGVHGMSVVESCKDAIALARACELHGARFFGNGARPGFVLSTDGELNAEARESLRANWERMHGGVNNSNRTAVLVGGLKPIEIPQASMHDSQFIEARKWQLAEIARLFRVPLHLLGAETSPGSVEHAGLDYVQHTILPWLRRFESAFQRDLISDDDRYFVEFDVRGLMRGDAASRSAYYRAMWDIGALSTNDILELENRNPVEGGDERYRPLNMGTLGAPPSVDDVLAQQQEGSGIDGQAVEGGVAAAEGEPAPVVEEVVVEDATPQVAEVSLNGAQITGLIAIVQSISDGLVTREGAAAMIAASFPSIPPAQIDAILAGVVERQPAVAADAQPQPVPVVEDAPARSLQQNRDCGTGAGGFKPGNKCAPGGGEGGGDASGGSSSGAGGDAGGVSVSQKGSFLQATTDGGVVGGHVKDGALRISVAQLDPAKQGKGLGKAMYVKLIDEAHGQGLKVFSDTTVEVPAVRVYQSLAKDGYEVVTNPHGVLPPSDDAPAGAWYGTGGKPVFEVRPKANRSVLAAKNRTAQIGRSTPEARAEPGTVAEGDYVSWGSSGGRARGRIDHVMDYGRLDVPGTDFAIDATEDDPAALITVYEEVSGGWRATDTQVGHKVSTLTKIDPLPEPPPAEEPRAKPRRRRRG